jgi:phage/plasmid-like protein (TIGR03299 family)
MTALDINTTDPLVKIRSWEPRLSPALYEHDGMLDGAEQHGQICWRSDNGKPIGCVGPRYTTIPHAQVCDLFDQLANRGHIDRDTLRCGEFGGGSKIWIQATPQQGIVKIAGHEVQHKFTVCDGHDGSICLAVLDSAINIRCRNTYHMAYKSGKGTRLKHTRSITGRWDDLVKSILQSSETFKQHVDLLQHATTVRTDFADLKAALDRYFPMPLDETKRATVNEKRNRVAWAYEHAPAAQPGTRFGLYQAFTYYLSHEAGRDGTREQSVMLGTGRTMGLDVANYILN